MELTVYNITGEETGRKVKLNDQIFGVEPNDHAIWLDVTHYQRNKRQGTSKAKERSEIKGSTKKLRRQKGAGAARVGSIKSPIFRGGGRVFGPRPQEYNKKLNKKLKQLARKSALTYKAKQERILVVEDFKLEQPKTKECVNLRKNLKADDKKLLIVLKERDNNILLASRNIQDLEVTTVNELNTYQVMKAGKVMFIESSVSELDTIYTKQ